MIVTFCCTDTKAEPWLAGLRAALPEATVDVWQPGAPPADYAVVWTPPQAFLDEQPRLRALFNIGAGVDALLQRRIAPQTLIVRLDDAEAALADRPGEVVVFDAASEAFSQKNYSIAESIARFAPVVEAARQAGIAVRGAMSCTVGCPYEGEVPPDPPRARFGGGDVGCPYGGEVPPERVRWLAGLMKDIGVQRVDAADTIGVGTPLRVQRAIEATLAHHGIDHISGHLHDTYG